MSFDKASERSNHHQLGGETLQPPFVVFIEFLSIFTLIGAYIGVELYSLPSIDYLTCDQTDILRPYRPDTITTIQMIVFGFLIPTGFFIAIELVNSQAVADACSQTKTPGFKKANRIRTFREHLLHAFTLFLLGMFVTVLITEVAKRWVGRLRPHFIDVCKPKFDKINCYNQTANGRINNAIYTGGDFCTGDPKRIKEARLSFPSGHASYTTFCMVFLIIFLEARLFVKDLHFGKRLLQLAAFMAALLISLSRISDFQHRPSDVLAGFLLGLSVALIASYVARKVWLPGYNQQGTYFSFESIKSISDESIKASSEDTIL